MEAARAAVQDFTSRRGHSTEVDEIVQPGITRATIKPHRHEETTTALDKEVHQHHHHTTVQPIQHQEVLPEKHTHNLRQTEEREFVHGDPEEHKRRLAQHATQFQDSSTTHETHHTTSNAPQVSGEHVHHHVHELVQPVVHKETIQPEVVHTTHPVHEVHHHYATHHGMSALPVKTLDEFKSAGGILTGSKSNTHEKYEGEPRPYNKELETTMDKLGLAHHGSSNTSTTGAKGHEYTDSGIGGMGRNGASGYEDTSRTGLGSNGRDPGFDKSPQQAGEYRSSTGNYGSNPTRTSSEQTKKPGIMSRLNPMKDTDGDGKKGFMG